MRNFKQAGLYRQVVNRMNASFPVLVAKLRFLKMFGRRLNLEDPQDINEKILWLSLFSDTTEWSRCADKYAVREFVRERGCEKYLVPLLGKWDDPKDIAWDMLPESFVMKTNHGSGSVLIVPDKSKLDIPATVSKFERWLRIKQNASTTEFHYDRIRPCVVAEQMLDFTKDINESSSAIDYKIWCFNGRPSFVWTCANRDNDHTDVALFDPDWNYLPNKSVFNEHYRQQEVLVKKPVNLDEMLYVAAQLSAGFPVVRVDLYNINSNIYFGEMTFTSLGGTMNFYTNECLYEMGQMIDISNIKKVR